jgi:HD-GYP domain-containing protein (c-di-GMP phosphodiesterase class II)
MLPITVPIYYCLDRESSGASEDWEERSAPRRQKRVQRNPLIALVHIEAGQVGRRAGGQSRPVQPRAARPDLLPITIARAHEAPTAAELAISTECRTTALLLGNLVDATDPYTASHSRDVVQLALMVADDLRLDLRHRRRVEFGALLHDVGKVWIGDEIINKPGPLDHREWEIVRRHTIEGEAMLRPLGGIISAIGLIVRHTHEHHDGRGYPDGLAGDTIPIEARIISVCDACNAMTTDRSYRNARSRADALSELHRCAGSQFDPAIVRSLDRVLAAEAAATA